MFGLSTGAGMGWPELNMPKALKFPEPELYRYDKPNTARAKKAEKNPAFCTLGWYISKRQANYGGANQGYRFGTRLLVGGKIMPDGG